MFGLALGLAVLHEKSPQEAVARRLLESESISRRLMADAPEARDSMSLNAKSDAFLSEGELLDRPFSLLRELVTTFPVVRVSTARDLKSPTTWSWHFGWYQAAVRTIKQNGANWSLD